MSVEDNGSLLWVAGGERFRTILADPAWPSASHTGPRTNWLTTNTKPRYTTMKAEDILGLPVDEIAHKDAMLVLWSTWMHLSLAIQCIEEWGFRYCTGMPWLKVTQDRTRAVYGPGVWFQHCTELVLLGRRGKPFGELGNPRPARKGIVIAPRGEHSEKPVELYQWIEEKFPGPMLEMFARARRPGWVQWGNELEEAQV